MKILFIYSVPSGGVETMNRLRCHALASIGIECHLLYLSDGAGRGNIRGIPLFITNRDDELAGILRANNYDLIVSVCDHVMLQRLRTLGFAGSLIYEAQGLGRQEQALSTLSNAAPFIRHFANGAITHAASHLMEMFNSILYDFPRFYVQNIVDTNLFQYVHAPGLNPSGQPILGWVGRLEANKNWRLFLQIAITLRRIYPGIQLWMFEDANIYEPGERELFSQIVHQQNLLPHLVLRSNIPHDHMPHYLSVIGNSGGMLVSTSFVESFGYAAAEALACRCPVLATDSDGIRSSIIHNVTGKFFSGSLHHAVQEAVDLIENKKLREAIRTQGEQYIRTTYSPERYVADFNNILIALGIKTVH